MGSRSLERIFVRADLEEIEFVTKISILHVTSEASGETSQCVKHAVGVFRHIDFHRHQAVNFAQLGAADSGMPVMG